VSSRSIAADLAAYARTRLLRLRILALGVGVGVCGAAASALRFETLPASIALAMALVWQFRLWDDLEDTAYDRALHPERILVATKVPGAFRWALALSVFLFAAALAITRGPLAAAVYVALAAAAAALYRFCAARPSARLLRSHLVLAKYPVFVWLAAAHPSALRAAMIGIGLYLALCLFEVADDPALRASPKAWGLAIAEGIALLGVLAYGATR